MRDTPHNSPLTTTSNRILPAFKKMVWNITINALLSSPLFHSRIRVAVLRAAGLRIGHDTQLEAMCHVGGRDIIIGDHTHVNWGCFLDNSGPIRIGSGCGIGMETMICTGTHEIGNKSMRRSPSVVARAVVIEDGCWLGTRALVLPGITIGYGCVISAGALITADCEPNGLYAGVPARRIRDLP